MVGGEASHSPFTGVGGGVGWGTSHSLFTGVGGGVGWVLIAFLLAWRGGGGGGGGGFCHEPGPASMTKAQIIRIS